MLEDYCYSLLAAGQSPRTIATRRRQLAMMLRSIGDPTTATHRDLVRWLADPTQLLGHSSPATTQGYIRVDGDDLRRAAAAAS